MANIVRPLFEELPLALFTDIEPESKPRKRRWLGSAIFGVALAVIVVVGLLPAPYVIEQPGPVFNVLGDVTVKGAKVPLIEIPTEKTYKTDGTLDMLTVSIVGDRQDPASWFDIARAYFDPSRAIVPVDEIYPAGTTLQESNQQGTVDMQNSQKEAIAAALTELGYTFPSTLTVVQTQKGAPADGKLTAGDTILSLDGTAYTDVSALRAGIAANGTDKPAEVVVERAGEQKTFEVTPTLSTGADPVPILGIVVGSDYQFPVDVTIQLENVGGPSAGQMFALGIIDKLTPGELNGGKDVAGTGTITAAGDVGPIGGIRQKLYGARAAGATYFLAPKSNCNEVTGHVPAGLTVFAVSTLGDSLKALKALESGSDTSALPTCPAG
ncbi:MAG: S16 family serine protease [Rhodoglobus sp.]